MKENASTKRTRPGHVPSSQIHTRSPSHRPKSGSVASTAPKAKPAKDTAEAKRKTPKAEPPLKKRKSRGVQIAPGAGLDPDVVLTPI
jgi:hypothetical protein